MKEIFVDIVDHEGVYQISNYGNVKNILRNKVLKPWDNGNGYAYISLVKNGKTFKYGIHRLVCNHFLSNCDNLKEVNHKDGNKFNNNLSNLEWCTPSHNGYHRQTMLDNKREATFHFLNPEGLEVHIVNLTRYCRDNNISVGMMFLLNRGKVKSFKGWTKL